MTSLDARQLREEALRIVEGHFDESLVKCHGQTMYQLAQTQVKVVCLTAAKVQPRQWFSLTPQQRSFLDAGLPNGWVALACGDADGIDAIFLVPYRSLEPLIDELDWTEHPRKPHWHFYVVQYESGTALEDSMRSRIADLTPYAI